MLATSTSNAPTPSSFIQIDVAPACAIERCVLFATGITLLLALLAFVHAIFALVIGRLEEGTVAILFALLLVAVYGFIRLCCRVLTNRIALVVALTIVLLSYTALTISLTLINWLAATFLWLVCVTLWLSTIRSFHAFRSGGIDLFLAVAKFQRRSAYNGSFMRYALQKGLSSDGILYFGAAITSLLLIPVARQYFPDYLYSDLILIAFAWWCYRRGGQLGLEQAIQSSSEVKSAFVTFYLRSFLDDAAEVAIATRNWVEGLISVLFGGKYLDAMLGYSGNLEEVAVAALWPFDPVVCLGKSSSQPMGAIRFDVFDGDWQALATRLFHSANRILLMISFTTGLAWELREIFSRQLQNKLILLVPPELPTQTAARWAPGSLAAEQLLTRWNESISGTPLADVPATLLRSSIAIRFHDDGHAILLVSSSRTAVVYAVALRAACLPATELDELATLSRARMPL